VPTLAYDQSSIWLVWNKPDNYANIVDYNVYMNGKLLGCASANAAKNSPAAAYINNFYKADKAAFHVRMTYHAFLATGLKPNTRYNFTVRSLCKRGKESGDSAVVTAKTAPEYAKVIT
jgi:exo-poly-alpha-galacturonosidase